MGDNGESIRVLLGVIARSPYLRLLLIFHTIIMRDGMERVSKSYKRKTIPLSARIFSIIDVYDALVNKRPTRNRGQEKGHSRD
jgi:hypothetical protein